MVTRVGFGIPLFIVEVEAEATTSAPGTTEAPATEAPGSGLPRDRVTSYSSMTAIAEDYSEGNAAYKMAQAAFSQDTAPTRVKIGLKLVSETYVEALNECISSDNDWYGLAIESKDAADILAVAAAVESMKKIFGASSSDAGIKSPSASDDVMSQLKAASYARSYLFFHTQADTYHPECALFGCMLPTDPGSATWKFKTLSGIPVDSFTTQERDTLIAKGANIYESIAGVSITREGVMAEGPAAFIDIIHGIDWLQQRMMERIYIRLHTAPKVPYTNTGIASIESLVRAQLEQGIAYGVIAPEPRYTITVPDVLDTDEGDRANRILRDITFNARLAGAIHTIDITGTVTV